MNASDEAVFPYCVYAFDSIDFSNRYRDDNIVTIDIWDKNDTPTNLLNLKDKIEGEFDYSNEPGTEILPTFYIDMSFILDDEDKTLQHAQVRILVQNYSIGE